MNYKLFFPTPIQEVDPINDNIDVCITLEDGSQYTLVITTPDNLKALMKKENLSYIEPSLPFCVVDKITEDNIKKLVESLLNDEKIFLKIYGSDLTSLIQ